jgi:hypothetical protein
MSFYRVHVAETDGQQVVGPEALFELDCGERIEWPANEPAKPEKRIGKLYGWLSGNCWCPFVSHSIKNRLAPLVGDSVQWHGPFDVRGCFYFFLNCINVIDCALPGSDSNQLLIASDVVGDSALFRPRGFTRDLICSQEFRDNCVNSGDTGVRFGRIKEDGWEEFPWAVPGDLYSH